MHAHTNHMCLMQEKQGEVKHVYRGHVFIQARNVLENAGIIVCRAKHIELAGGASNAVTVGREFVPKSPRLSSPAPHRGQGSDGTPRLVYSCHFMCGNNM